MDNVVEVKQNSPDVTDFVTVIIRAYGDEPVRLKVVGCDGRVVDVIGEVQGDPVSFPIQWAYVDDERTYGMLLDAHEAGDFAKLRTLWKSAGRFNG